MRLKAYKYRIYPNEKQKILIEKTFGCCRYVYNRALARKMAYYQEHKKGLSLFNLIDEMVSWKKEKKTEWLNDVNSQALQMAIRNLDNAYTKFFRENKGFPNFKTKHNNYHSFQNSQQTHVDFENKRVRIIKFTEGIKCVFDREFEGKIKTSTVSKAPSGKYFISILVEEDVKLPTPSKPKEATTVGIDLGLKDFAVLSTGEKIKNPKHLNNHQKRLARLQRIHSRKKKGSRNREKQRIIVARCYEKIVNARKDFIHKLTSRLANIAENQSYAIEDLNVNGMMQNHKLARSISDAAWNEFVRCLKYKCEWTGKNVLTIGRFDPSSRLCPCGYYNTELRLSDREWTCPICGTKHDRDELAASNIKRFAFCRQNTYKLSKVGPERPEPSFRKKEVDTPLESGNARSSKKEILSLAAE